MRRTFTSVCVRACAVLSVVCVLSVMRVRSRLAVVDATPRAKDDEPRRTKPTVASASVQRARSNPLSSWLAITSVCVDEGDKRAPDGQENTARNYMHITMANHAAYAAVHGYPYRPLTSSFPGMREKDVRYHKLGWVRQLLDNYTWVFYTDCDSLFIDFCVDISKALTRIERRSEGHNINLVLTGDKGWAMNSGQFIVRNTEWSKDILYKASLEPRNTHGCVGNDNAAFNWLLWADCSSTKGDFTTWWNDVHRCRQAIQRSLYAEKLACAPLNTYSQHLAEARKRGPVFRLHFAGSQKKKTRLIKLYAKSVDEDVHNCDPDAIDMPIVSAFG